jgi:hypothetical protein
MGLGPIPRSSIMSFAAEHGMFGDEADFFFRLMRTVDSQYLSTVNAKPDKKRIDEVSVQDSKGMRDAMNRMKARARAANKTASKTNGKP